MMQNKTKSSKKVAKKQNAPAKRASSIAKQTLLRALNPSPLAPAIIARYGEGINYKGREYLGPVTAYATGSGAIPNGSDVFYADITPSGFGWAGSRLKVEATLWEKFKFNSIKFRFVPSLNVFNAGNVTMYYDYDWLDAIPPISDSGLRVSNEYFGSKTFAVNNEPGEVVCEYKALPGRMSTESFFTSDPYVAIDPRLNAMGWFAMKVSNMNNINGTFGPVTNLGMIIAEYDIDFYIAQNDSVDTGPKKGTFNVPNPGASQGNNFTFFFTSTDVVIPQDATKTKIFKCLYPTYYQSQATVVSVLSPGIEFYAKVQNTNGSPLATGVYASFAAINGGNTVKCAVTAAVNPFELIVTEVVADV